MGTATITGPITSIVYDDSAPANFTLVPLSDGTDGVDPPTTISPSGTPVTVVLATNTNSGGFSPSGFAMSSSFNVGDVVEVYLIATSSGTNLEVFDENGNTIFTTSGLNNGGICRKLTTGAGKTWGSVT